MSVSSVCETLLPEYMVAVFGWLNNFKNLHSWKIHAHPCPKLCISRTSVCNPEINRKISMMPSQRTSDVFGATWLYFG